MQRDMSELFDMPMPMCRAQLGKGRPGDDGALPNVYVGGQRLPHARIHERQRLPAGEHGHAPPPASPQPKPRFLEIAHPITWDHAQVESHSGMAATVG